MGKVEEHLARKKILNDTSQAGNSRCTALLKSTPESAILRTLALFCYPQVWHCPGPDPDFPYQTSPRKNLFILI
jgi:hypothetical protein